MRLILLFLLSLAIGTIVTVAYHALSRPRPAPGLGLREIAPQIFISGQIYRENLEDAVVADIRTVVDMRPDGEAPDQLSSDAVKELAAQYGIAFAYVPVPHGGVPQSCVARLGQELTAASKPVLLYCRSGNRAMRAYALLQAERPDGPSRDDINALAARNGFDLKDLQDELTSRIARRQSPRAP